MPLKSPDPDRLASAYRAMHARLWKALYLWSGSRHIADEAEAEAFAQAARRLDEIRDIQAWVWRSAFRIGAGLFTSGAATRTMHLELVPEAALAVVDPIVEPAAELRAALAGLSEQQRRCVVLKHVGGFSAKEIASIVESTEGAVRVHIHRALRQLRSALEPAGSRQETS